MRDARDVGAVLDGQLDERLAERVLDAAETAAPGEEVHDAVTTLVEIAEIDPEGTRDALWALRGDPEALTRLEAQLRLSPRQATLALGGAIQVACAALSSPEPDLASHLEELVRWLEGSW